MSNYKFSKPPLLPSEKEKKTAEFMNTACYGTKEKTKKESIVQLHLRMTESLWQDIKEVTARTGLSMNAVCLSSLHAEIKRKLKELRE